MRNPGKSPKEYFWSIFCVFQLLQSVADLLYVRPGPKHWDPNLAQGLVPGVPAWIQAQALGSRGSGVFGALGVVGPRPLPGRLRGDPPRGEHLDVPGLRPLRGPVLRLRDVRGEGYRATEG